MTELKLFRGDTLPLSAQVVLRGTTTPVNLTNKTIRFTVKGAYGDPDSVALLKLISPTRITFTDAVNGIINWAIQPNDIAALARPIPQRLIYVWDLQYSDTSDSASVYTLDSGTLTVEPDVTTTAP